METFEKNHISDIFIMKAIEYQRVLVQTLHDLGHSNRLIMAETGKSKSFVQRWISRDTIDRHPGSGRPLKITRSIRSSLITKLRMKKLMSSRLVARQMNVSKTSVLKIAHDAGLFPYHPRKKPVVTEKHKKLRKMFSKKHKAQDWTKVLFTDEAKVSIVQQPNSKNDVIWAPIGSIVPPTPGFAHPLQLNVCAGICYNGKTEIFIFKEALEQKLYKKILETTIIPGAKKLMGNDWQLLSDNDPKHTAKSCMNYLHENHISRMDLPANSPDINIIENVWSMMIDELKHVFPKNEKQLRKAIKNAWKQIQISKIKNCIESMPRRLKLVLASKGNITKY